MNFRVLSIDAWASYDGTDDSIYDWTWNNWFNAGEYSEEEFGPLTEENAMKFFLNDFQVNQDLVKEFESNYEIEDDQYNLVLVKKENRMPIAAIEYGNKQ
jgi:hypothetical protein